MRRFAGAAAVLSPFSTILRIPVAMPVPGAIQFRNAESPAIGSFRRRCEMSVLASPQTVPGGLAGTLYTMPFCGFYLRSG